MNNPRVAVIEDDAWMLSFLTDLFEKNGYEVEPIYGHYNAVQRIREFNPDVLVVDIQLDNGYTGYELSEELSGDKSTQHIPTVFITADNTSENRCKAFMCGALDFITKPFNKQELMERIAPLASIGRLSKLLNSIGAK